MAAAARLWLRRRGCACMACVHGVRARARGLSMLGCAYHYVASNFDVTHGCAILRLRLLRAETVDVPAGDAHLLVVLLDVEQDHVEVGPILVDELHEAEDVVVGPVTPPASLLTMEMFLFTCMSRG